MNNDNNIETGPNIYDKVALEKLESANMVNSMNEDLKAFEKLAKSQPANSDTEFSEKIQKLTEMFDNMDEDTQERMLRESIGGIKKSQNKDQAKLVEQKNKKIKAKAKAKLSKASKKKNRK